MASTLTVALVSEVFWQPDGEARLTDRLKEAADKGAELALLPEIPLNPWRPATKDAVDDDAEEEGGRRTQVMARAAAATGVGIVGGIIRRDPATGRRTSRALLFDGRGEIVGRYEKLHLPEEPGFWETSALRAGHRRPAAVRWLWPGRRHADLLRHQPARGIAPARRPGRRGDPDPTRHRARHV